MVDNQTESLTHVDFDPATFDVTWLFEEILKMATSYIKAFQRTRKLERSCRFHDLSFSVCITHRSWVFRCCKQLRS